MCVVCGVTMMSASVMLLTDVKSPTQHGHVLIIGE